MMGHLAKRKNAGEKSGRSVRPLLALSPIFAPATDQDAFPPPAIKY